MSSIPFPRPPASLTLGEALSLAARYWTASWERWVLAVVAVGLAGGLARWLLGTTTIDQEALTRLTLPGGSGVDPSVLPGMLAGPLAVAIVSLVADWFLYANAVAGLRGRDVTLGWVVRAGLRTLLVLLAVAIGFSAATVVLVALGLLGLIALILAFPVLLYAGIRLQFWTVGIFDGLGIEAAARESWRLTRGAVLRVLGWSLALLGLSLLVGLASTPVSLLFASQPVIPAAIGAVLGTAFQAFTLIVIAILYESQRGRAMGSPPGGQSRSRPPAATPTWTVDATGRPVPPSDDPDAPTPPPPPPPAG